MVGEGVVLGQAPAYLGVASFNNTKPLHAASAVNGGLAQVLHNNASMPCSAIVTLPPRLTHPS